MNEIVQKIVIENSHMGDKNFEQLVQTLSEQERTSIQELGLMHFLKRQELEWTLQGHVENIMYQESNYDDIEIITDSITKLWNEQQSFPLTGDVIEAFILRQFKSINHRKAYGEICESDIASYKLFVNDPSFFAQYVIRQLFTYENMQPKHIYPIFSWLFSAYFEEESEPVYLMTLKKLQLSVKKKPTLFIGGKAFAQGRLAKEMELPFISSIENLYIQQYEQSNNKTVPQIVVNFMNTFVLKKVQPKQEKQAIEIVQPIISEAPVQQEPQIQEVPIQQEPTSAEHEMIDGMIAQLQQLKTKMTTPIVEASDQQLKIAEEEIMRLRQAIQGQEMMLRETKDQAYTQLIEFIGGSRSNYLLSDLYKESLDESTLSRDLIQGQLLNLFNTLGSLMQLEAMTNGYEIGEVFDCDRSVLAHQFRILSSISSEEEIVRVKLLQYGWSVNGKVIVQPQVVEMKEVH